MRSRLYSTAGRSEHFFVLDSCIPGRADGVHAACSHDASAVPPWVIVGRCCSKATTHKRALSAPSWSVTPVATDTFRAARVRIMQLRHGLDQVYLLCANLY